jgi:hypothetical protein
MCLIIRICVVYFSQTRAFAMNLSPGFPFTAFNNIPAILPPLGFLLVVGLALGLSFGRYVHNCIILKYICYSGPGSSVGIATDYGLDGPGIESRWGRDFSHSSRPVPGAHLTSCTMGNGSFPEVKRPGRGADNPPPSSAEVENE